MKLGVKFAHAEPSANLGPLKVLDDWSLCLM